jgi:hypothetical protein
MATIRRIVLYGKSLVVSAIGASLQACADLELVHVDPRPAEAAGLGEAAERLAALKPVAIVFDQTTTGPDLVGALLRDQPELILIGVDPSSDRVLVLSGRQERPVSAGELARLIVGSRAVPHMSEQ